MNLKTIVEVAQILSDDATTTQAETTAAVEVEPPIAWLKLVLSVLTWMET